MPATDPQRHTVTRNVKVSLSATVEVTIEPGRDNADYVQHQVHDRVKQDSERLYYLENLEVEDIV